MLKHIIADQVAVITIDRPERRNALGSQLAKEFSNLFWELDQDDTVRGIVIEGTPPGFCAGSDLKELGGMTIAGMRRHEADTAAVARSIASLSKPVIAAVDGFALGGGFILATSCDIVVTSTTCMWHLPEVTIGWIPPWGLESLVARTGSVIARRLTWGAKPIDGAEAYRLGVADFLTEPGRVRDEALNLANQLAALPAVAVAATKRYFSAAVSVAAEARDNEANLLFSENCQYEAAKKTLRKFGMKIQD